MKQCIVTRFKYSNLNDPILSDESSAYIKCSLQSLVLTAAYVCYVIIILVF